MAEDGHSGWRRERSQEGTGVLRVVGDVGQRVRGGVLGGGVEGHRACHILAAKRPFSDDTVCCFPFSEVCATKVRKNCE